MQFSERQLVELFLKNTRASEYAAWIDNRAPNFHYRKTRPYFPKRCRIQTEYALPSGRRIDLLVSDASVRRLAWIIEFKVEAAPNALVQAFEYWEELSDNLPSIHIAAITICAQYFHPHTLFFADRMGIQCLHIAPVNNERAEITQISECYGLEVHTRGYGADHV